jgi:uncharacterized lipoprotein YajG
MKNRILLASAVIASSILAQGCSLKQQNLHIDPEIKVKAQGIGEGKTLGLRVMDERTDKKLGEVGDPDRKLVDVRVDEDPSPAIFERVDGMDRTLDISVRKLELQSLKQPLTFETELRAEVAAHAVSGSAYYDRQFNVRTRKVGAAPPYQKDSTLLVNTALSQALEDLLSDEDLVGLLAK